MTGVCQCDTEYPGRAPNGHSWNYLNNIVLDKTLKYKVNTHESILYVGKYPRLYIHESIHKSATEFFNEEECTNLRWSDCEEIPPRPRAEKPQQEGRCWSGGYVVLEWLWGDTPLWRAFALWEREGQSKRSPSKMVGGAKLCLESNSIPARDAQRAQTHLVRTRTQRPQRDWDRTVSVSRRGTGQQWTAAGAGALDEADLGVS